MKQTPRMAKIQANMRPGVMSLHGFLGTDPRDLADILAEDDGLVRRKGYTHRDIAERMMELREIGLAGLEDFITVDPYFEVRVESVRGKLPCPFGDPGIFPKTNITVRNLKTGKEVVYTDLHIHMVQAHGFYEGKGSPFRIDPVELAEILEVKPEEN